MDEERKLRPLTPEEAERAVAGFEKDAEDNGVWVAVCKCGVECGMRLASHGPPPPEDIKYIACPACRGLGRNGDIKYHYDAG